MPVPILDNNMKDRIADDLRGILRGEVLSDPIPLMAYSTDGSMFQIEPLLVVIPANEKDVTALVRYSSQNKIPLIPRGNGTSSNGSSLGNGIMVDLSRNFQKIDFLEDGHVHLGCSVNLETLIPLANDRGFRVPCLPDHSQHSIGGWISNDFGGRYFLTDGYLRNWLAGLKVVLDDGSIVWLGSHPICKNADDVNSTRKGIIHDELANLEESLRQNIDDSSNGLAMCHGTYNVRESLGRDQHWKSIPGSEGTLAIILEAVLRLPKTDRSLSHGLICFQSATDAILASGEILKLNPMACDIYDHRLCSLARNYDNLCMEWIPQDCMSAMIITFSNSSNANPVSEASLKSALLNAGIQPLKLYLSRSDENQPSPWRLHEIAFKALRRIKGSGSFLPFLGDIAIPAQNLANFLEKAPTLFKEHDATTASIIRPGSGSVQFFTFGAMKTKAETTRLWALANSIFQEACRQSANISNQESTGLVRIPWHEQQCGKLFQGMKKIKSAWDPFEIFNPGKIVGPSSDLPVWPFKILENQSIDSATENRGLIWKELPLAEEAFRCNGCGACKTHSLNQRMCPVHKAKNTETSSPRAMVNLGQFLHQSGKSTAYNSEEMREIAEQCFGCKMCLQGCPSHVDVPGLMLDAKVAHTETHGMNRLQWFLSRAENLAGTGSKLAPFSNWILGNPIARWVMEKAFGISRKRKIQPFARSSFLKIAKKRGWTNKPLFAKNRVALFVDAYGNYNDPSIAEAAVEVLHHNGIEVFVPENQSGCGMAALAQGDLEYAGKSLRNNLRAFADLAREGFPIICLEPTSAIFFTQDARRILDDPDIELVCSQIKSFTSYMGNLYQEGLLKTDFKRLNARLFSHIPCHEKALGNTNSLDFLYQEIPGVEFENLPDACSGMAGTFGLAAHNLELSLKIGRPMLEALAKSSNSIGLTSCSSCKMQMEFGSSKGTFHPAQILAAAYDLMPSLKKRIENARR